MSDKKNKLKALEAMMEGDLTKHVGNPVDQDLLSERVSKLASIDDLTAPKNLGERMASKSQLAALETAKKGIHGSKMAGKEVTEGLFSKLASKVGSKGMGKAAGLALGGPMALMSEAADAGPLGESPEAENMMVSEAQARNDYRMSPAHTDKLRASGEEVPELPDNEAFSRMRALRDGRAADIREGQEGDAGLRQMLDEKESIQDRAESNLSQEQREEIAQRNLDKKRKGLGLSGAINPNQGEEL